MIKQFTFFCLIVLIQFTTVLKGQNSSDYPFSTEINVDNFVITSSTLTNNRIDFKFDIEGKYQSLDMYVYEGEIINSNNIISVSYWNRDKDEPIFYPNKITRNWFNNVIPSKYVNHRINGKYILVLDYWYNGVKQTKTLEYNKEIPAPPKRNDVKITNVKIRNVMDSFSKPPIYNSSNPTIPTIQSGQQYVAHITVGNVGDLDIDRQLAIDLRGYDRTNPNSLLFSFPTSFPSIKKGGQVYEFPITFNQGVSTFQDPNALEILIHIDPSNSLNDKNLVDNKHIIKYKFKGPFGRSSSNTNNIEVFDASGNKVKSVSVDDAEKGVLEVKKSLPKGHYYFNIDGKKTQVKID